MRKTRSHQQLFYLLPSIHGNHWIIYKPLPRTLRLCEREGGFAELTTTTMLGPAAVRAAAAAVWLLAVSGLGLSQPDEHSSDPGFSLCSDCFYRQTPPQGASAGLQLRPRCHELPGGQAFATLSRPICDTAVYTAFHLRPEWIEKGEENVVRTHLSLFLKYLILKNAFSKVACRKYVTNLANKKHEVESLCTQIHGIVPLHLSWGP